MSTQFSLTYLFKGVGQEWQKAILSTILGQFCKALYDVGCPADNLFVTCESSHMISATKITTKCLSYSDILIVASTEWFSIICINWIIHESYIQISRTLYADTVVLWGIWKLTLSDWISSWHGLVGWLFKLNFILQFSYPGNTVSWRMKSVFQELRNWLN